MPGENVSPIRCHKSLFCRLASAILMGGRNRSLGWFPSSFSYILLEKLFIDPHLIHRVPFLSVRKLYQDSLPNTRTDKIYDFINIFFVSHEIFLSLNALFLFSGRHQSYLIEINLHFWFINRGKQVKQPFIYRL